MTAKEVFENLIRTIEKAADENNEAVITNVKLWAKSWRREMETEVNNSVSDDVNGMCCENPKHATEVNDMFESWTYCKNCDKDIV